MRETLIVIISGREESVTVVRNAVRRHSESNYKKSSATKQLFYEWHVTSSYCF